MLGLIYNLVTKQVVHKLMFDISEYAARKHFEQNFDTAHLGYCLSDEADRLGILDDYTAPSTVMRDPELEAKDDANTNHWSMYDPHMNSYGAI